MNFESTLDSSVTAVFLVRVLTVRLLTTVDFESRCFFFAEFDRHFTKQTSSRRQHHVQQLFLFFSEGIFLFRFCLTQTKNIFRPNRTEPERNNKTRG